MKGPTVELVKGFAETAETDVTRHVPGRSPVEDGPAENRITPWLPRHAAIEEQGGVLGFKNKRFQSTGGDRCRDTSLSSHSQYHVYQEKGSSSSHLFQHSSVPSVSLGLSRTVG